MSFFLNLTIFEIQAYRSMDYLLQKPRMTPQQKRWRRTLRMVLVALFLSSLIPLLRPLFQSLESSNPNMLKRKAACASDTMPVDMSGKRHCDHSPAKIGGEFVLIIGLFSSVPDHFSISQNGKRKSGRSGSVQTLNPPGSFAIKVTIQSYTIRRMLLICLFYSACLPTGNHQRRIYDHHPAIDKVAQDGTGGCIICHTFSQMSGT